MKSSTILSLFSVVLVGVIAKAQVLYDVDGFASREPETREDLVLRALYEVKRQAEDHIDVISRMIEELDDALYARALWGRGNFQMDQSYYHKNVKPVIQKRFRAQYPEFQKLCGKNPNFDAELDGTVYPGVVMSGKSGCTKQKFRINMKDELIRLAQDAAAGKGKKKKRSFDGSGDTDTKDGWGADFPSRSFEDSMEE